MSTFILNNKEISGIANYAANQGLGLATIIGQQLHKANVECWNNKYSKNDPFTFELENIHFDAEKALETLYTWASNSISSNKWFFSHKAAPLYNRIRQACFAPETSKSIKAETKFGFTVGEPILFDLANSKHAGYVVGFNQDMPSLTYGMNGMEKESGQQLLVVLGSQFDKSIYMTAAPIEYVQKDNTLTNMPAAQALNAMNIQVKKEDAIKLERENQRKKEEEIRQTFKDKIRNIIPENSKGVIVAMKETYNVEQSDPYGDYHKIDTDEVIILGFSKHNRGLFSELRKFAKTHEKTAFLADLDDRHEDRTHYNNRLVEKSMGHANGWTVEKIKFYREGIESKLNDIPTGEISDKLLPKTPAKTTKRAESSPSFDSLLFSAH